MSPIDPKDAIVRLIEDTSLYDSLTEDQTKVLHAWGEGQLRQHANRIEDGEAFEAWFGDLRGVLKMVNRTIGKRGELDAEKKRTYIQHLVDKAQTAGYPPTLAQVGPIINALEPLDDLSALRGLLNFVENGTTTAPGMIDAPAPRPEASYNEMTTEVMPLSAVREALEAIRREHEALSEAETIEADSVLDVETPQDVDGETGADDAPQKPNLWRRPGLDDIPGADRK